MITTLATASDLDAIVALERDSFDHAPWSAGLWAGEFAAANRLILVTKDADEHVVAVATFAAGGDVVDLLRVVVSADLRGQGLGRRLVRAGFEWAEAKGADRMMLEVDTTNAAALALYRGLGFEPVAKRQDYYGAGVPALVMSRELGRASDEGEP